MLGAEVQHRQRQPDLIVPVALRSQGREPAGEDRRDGLFRRGLRDAPGHADDERREPATPARRDGRPEAVHDPDDGDVDTRLRHGPGHQDRGGAAFDGIGDVGVTVGPLTGQGHEQAARDDQARIDGCVADGSGGPGEEPAAGQADQVVRRQGWLRRDVRRPNRRVGVGHGRQSRIRDTH